MPSSFNNKPSFWQKLQSKGVNRSYVLTLLALTLALVVIIVAAVAANRTKKPTEIPNDPPKSTDKVTEKPTEPESTEPNATEKPTDKPSSLVGNKLPSFILPVSGNLSREHDPALQVFSPTMQDYRVHLGIDITTVESAPVYAAASGKIEKVWEDVRYGQCIAIAHSGGAMTIYKNLSAELADGIAEGASVTAGALIGAVGNTAMVEIAEDPHLHFEMTVDGIAVDPLDYFDASALSSLQGDAAYEK